MSKGTGFSNDALLVLAGICVFLPTFLVFSEFKNLGVWDTGSDLRGDRISMIGGRVAADLCEYR